jgi:hypothetical protein
VSEGPEHTVYSADCGESRVLPGGKQVRGIANLFLGGLRIFRGGSWEEMAGRLIGSLRDQVTADSNEFIRVRAGGAVLDGRAVMLPSTPEPHLPALVASLVRAGAPYLGDEIVNVDPVLGRLHGISLPLLIDAGDIAHFPELRSGRVRSRRREAVDLGAKGPRWPLPLDELGGTEASPTPLGWIVFPSFRPGAPTRFEPMGKSEALFAFTEALLNLHIWTERALTLVQRLLDGAWAGRLVVGSLEEAAHLITTLPSGSLREEAR